MYPIFNPLNGYLRSFWQLIENSEYNFWCWVQNKIKSSVWAKIHSPGRMLVLRGVAIHLRYVLFATAARHAPGAARCAHCCCRFLLRQNARQSIYWIADLLPFRPCAHLASILLPRPNAQPPPRASCTPGIYLPRRSRTQGAPDYIQN